MGRVVWVGFGSGALDGLREAITAAKAGDPMQAVTVCAPSNIAGLHLRRRLSPTVVGDGPGLSNVRFQPLERVAELVASASGNALNKTRLTPEASQRAAARALRETDQLPANLRAVAESRTTIAAVARTLEEIRRADPRQTPRLGIWQEVFTRYRAILEPAFVDQEEIFELATAVIHVGSAVPKDVGQVVLHLPEALSPRALRFAAAIHADAVIGLSGTPGDDAAIRLAHQLGALENVPELSAQVPDRSRCALFGEAAEEIAYVVGEVARCAARGIPLPRIAILGPDSGRYDALIAQTLASEGIPCHGRGTTTLAQSVPGRALLGMLRLADGRFERADVLDWIGSAPLRDPARGTAIPAERWGRIVRDAKIVRGRAGWARGLQRLADVQRQRAQEPGKEHLAARGDAVDALAAFIEGVADRLQAPGDRTWSGWCAWAQSNMDVYLPEGSLGDDSQFDEVRQALQSLSRLAEVEGEVDRTTFVTTVESVLSRRQRPTIAYGQGVYRGSLRDAAALDFDAVFLVGMTEGSMPSSTSDDPILPDSVREAFGEDFPRRGRAAKVQRRAYLAARACAPEVTFCAARADRAAGRSALPSPWFLEEATRLARTEYQDAPAIYASDLDRYTDREWLVFPPSLEGRIRHGEPASRREFDVRWLLSRPGPATEHPLAETLKIRRGLSALQGRRSRSLTPFDGWVGATAYLAADPKLSASSLEHLARCPFRFLLQRVLQVAETEIAEETVTIEPMDRGNAIHAALREFVQGRIDHGARADDEDRMADIADRALNALEESGRVGHATLWAQTRAEIRELLVAFVKVDDAARERGEVPVYAEFGFGAAVDLRLELPPGETGSIRVTGSIDRIDRDADGGLIITDYKTGSRDRFKALEKDPLNAGREMQLPLYAAVARQALANEGSVRAQYVFWKDREVKPLSLALTDEVSEAFLRRLRALVDAVQSGVFPAIPGGADQRKPEHCNYCPYDRVCGTDRSLAWERKQSDPRLVNLIATGGKLGDVE